MKRGHLLSIANMTKAIEKYRGNLQQAAIALKCSRETIYRFLKKNKRLLAQVESAREGFVDDVETALHNQALGKFDKKGKVIIAPSAIAGIFILKTRAKKRGYIERADLIPALKVAEFAADVAAVAANFARPEQSQECLDTLQRLARAHFKNFGVK